MADDKKGTLLLRPRFLLFCLYVMCYVALRGYAEIILQQAPVQMEGRMVQTYIVGSSPEVPRWRRQVYRVVFSPLMVAEEEGRRLAGKGRGLVSDAEKYGRSFLPD
jgi:hypothetical protein